MSDQIYKSQIHVVPVTNGLQLKIDVPTKKGGVRMVLQPSQQPSPEILEYIKNPFSVNEKVINVEFEMDDGQPKRVRLAGQPWVEPTPAPAVAGTPRALRCRH